MVEKLDTPIALLVFNRPEPTARVFEAIRCARPRHLLVIADGPRLDRPGETERCAAVRALIEQVDWDCRLDRNFSDQNLGCRKRVSTGLDWVFQQVPEAIILEDDCVPDPSFFAFCQELLNRYREDPRVMAITGDNFQAGFTRGDASYYFSRYLQVWGWATWRRAWQHYDVRMQAWPTLRDKGWLLGLLEDRGAARFWTKVFGRTHAGLIDTWDSQFLLAIWRQNGLTATPNRNLVTNVGVGADATHTTDHNPLLNLPALEADHPLRHPSEVVRDAHADLHLQRTAYSPSVRARVVDLLTKLSRRITSSR